MAQLALTLITGPGFALLLEGVRIAYDENTRFKSVLKDIQLRLECLQWKADVLRAIEDYNVQLSLGTGDIRILEVKMTEGTELVNKLSNIRIWNYCCVCGYADQLEDLKNSLDRLLHNLAIDGYRDTKEIVDLLRKFKDDAERQLALLKEVKAENLELKDSVKEIKAENLELKAMVQELLRLATNEASAETSSSRSTTEMVSNGVVQVLHSEVGASLGAVFDKLFDVVMQLKEKTVPFRSLLGDLKFMLECLKPFVEEIEVLDFPNDILEELRIQMEDGTKLVGKYPKVRVWAKFTNLDQYTNRLLRLDEYLRKQLNTFREQVARKVSEIVESTRCMKMMVEQIEESTGVLRNQIKLELSGEVPELSSSTVELEVPEVLETTTVARETLIPGKSIVEVEEVRLSEGSTSIGVQDQVDIKISSEVPEPPSPTPELEVLKVPETANSIKETLVSFRNIEEEVNPNEGVTSVVPDEIEVQSPCEILKLPSPSTVGSDVLNMQKSSDVTKTMVDHNQNQTQIGGAAAGLLFTMLYDAVRDAKVKIKLFKSLLGDLCITLQSLKPLLEDMDKLNKLLDRPPQELEDFKKQMQNGAELIPKCYKVRKWDLRKQHKYAKKLKDLDNRLKRVFYILNVKGVVDGLEILVTVKDTGEETKVMHEAIKQIAGSTVKPEGKEIVVVQDKIGFQGWDAVFEPPLITFGLDEPLRELKDKLLKDDVAMLVITALGGSGKTILAKKFCIDEDVKDKFNNNIFFVTVSQKSNLDAVTVSQAPAFRSEIISVTQLQQSLQEEGENPLLLVLDDVWDRSIVLEKFDELKMPNYKILVTSRSTLSGFGTPYKLKALNQEQSMTLLHHSADLDGRNPCVPKEILEQILKHCKGIPLAIRVTGKSLQGKATEVWRARLEEWSKSSFLDCETEFLDQLQSSIDSLDGKDAIIKECFMDLGSFPEDQRIPAAVLIDIWTEKYELDEDFSSISIIHELSTRGLANLVVTRKEKMEMTDDYYTEHFVTQHEMLRDLAIVNAKLDPIEDRERLIELNGDGEPKWLTEQKSQPIKARLVSISSDGSLSTKWKNIHLPNVEVLVLNFKTRNYALPEFVDKIDKLKVLVVTNYGVSPAPPAEMSNFELLGSLSNLKRLSLERISITSMLMNSIELKSVKKVSFFMCNIGDAFRNCCIKISDAFPSLEEMKIDYCNDLVELPADLCDLIHLKKLSITNCHKLSALPKEIGKLVNLEVLRLRSCTDLAKLPQSIKSLGKLDMLDISDCFSIKELPAEIGEICTLTKFNMRQCTRLKELPQSVMELEQLQEVICDEETEHLWEPFSSIFGNKIKVVKENINLDWLQHTRF